MRTKLYLAVAALLLFCGWATRPTGDIKKADWLLGTWENKARRGSIYESWNPVSEREFAGRSYMLKEKDTIVFETIRLVQEPGGVFYIPVVKNQNDNLPVRFAATTITDTALVFENPQHDFPQVITYRKINNDSLIATIAGQKNGQVRKQEFPMKRVK